MKTFVVLICLFLASNSYARKPAFSSIELEGGETFTSDEWNKMSNIERERHLKNSNKEVNNVDPSRQPAQITVTDPAKLQAPGNISPKEIKSGLNLVLELLDMKVKKDNAIDDWRRYQKDYAKMRSKLSTGQSFKARVYYQNNKYYGLLPANEEHLLPGDVRLPNHNDPIPFYEVNLIGGDLMNPREGSIDELLSKAKSVYISIPENKRTKSWKQIESELRKKFK